MFKEQLIVEKPIFVASQYSNGNYFQEEFDSTPSLNEITSFKGISLNTCWDNLVTGRGIMVRGDNYFIIRNNWEYEEKVSANEAYNHLIK